MKNKGWYIDHQTGSHIHFVHPERVNKVVVPYHAGKESLLDAKTTIADFSEFDPNPAQSQYEIKWLTVELPIQQTGDHAAQAA